MIPHVAFPAPRAGERYENLLKLMSVAEKMTRYGWRVDVQRIKEHKQASLNKIEKYKHIFLERTGLTSANLGRTGQSRVVRDYFREVLKAPDVAFDKKTRRPQFNTAALVTYATQFKQEPFGPPAAALYALRKNLKLSEFCDTYLLFAEHYNGRIHFGFNCAGTQTGRWSSSTRLRIQVDGKRKKYSCNVQQVPSKTPSFDFGAGQEILVDSLRDVFLPDEGCVLLKADYDQLELRLIAYMYGVKKLLDCIASGQDAHMLTASGIFKELNLDPLHKKVDKPRTAFEKLHLKARNAAKPCAYGFSYQMHSPSGQGKYPSTAKQLKEVFPTITEARVLKMVERFFELYPEIKTGQALTKDRIDEAGCVELSVDGRRLYYPETMRGYNQGLNFRMQGTGGALINRAVLELDPLLDWEGGCQLRAQVHDELVAQAPYARALEVKQRIEEAMSREAQIGQTYAGIPATADPGLNWGDCMRLDRFVARYPDLSLT